MVNYVIIVGRVGNASMYHRPDGLHALKLSIALHNSYRRADGSWVNATNWVNVTKFRPSEKHQQIEKGDIVAIEAHLTSNEGRIYVYPDKIHVLVKKNPIQQEVENIADPFVEPVEIPADQDFTFPDVLTTNDMTPEERWNGEPIDGDNDAELPF